MLEIQPKKAIIETAHTYAITNDVLSPRIKIELALADTIRQELHAHSIHSDILVLVDDVTPEIKATASVDSWRWRLFLGRDSERLASQTDERTKILSEYSFIESGETLINSLMQRVLDSDKYRLNTAKTRILYGSGKQRTNIALTQSIEAPQGSKILHKNVPSCEVLDLAVYQYKLKHTDIAITILHKSFKAQQKRVRELFTILDIPNPNIVIIYTNDEGHIDSIEPWNKGLTGLVNTLLGTDITN